jgi:putative FmdB family regulatory protein
VPIYEYVCSACHHRTDILHGIHEDGPTFCPACGAEGTMHKAFAVPAVHFKGTGWAKKERATGSKTKAAAAAESGGDGAKSDPGDKPPTSDSASSTSASSSSTDGGD